jgi:hypothetical protein
MVGCSSSVPIPSCRSSCSTCRRTAPSSDRSAGGRAGHTGDRRRWSTRGLQLALPRDRSSAVEMKGGALASLRPFSWRHENGRENCPAQLSPRSHTSQVPTTRRTLMK